jgi:hypothetical protein
MLGCDKCHNEINALVEALTKLSNEAMGSAEMARECIGNTNANVLLQRAQEARALIERLRA